MADRILNIKQVAELLCLSQETLRWMRFNGSGPFSFKVGRRISYYESDVQQYLDEQRDKERQRLQAMGK